jgi:hypothetical protein
MKKRKLIIGMLLFVFTLVTLALVVPSLWPNLSRPVSGRDWLQFQNLEGVCIQAGKPVSDCPAPLSRYVRVWRVGKSGSDTVSSWIDLSAKASYYLPLYKDGALQESYQLVRVSRNRFSAAPQGGGWKFKEYLGARQDLLHYSQANGLIVSKDYVLMMPGAASLIIADTNKGTFGKLFSSMPNGLAGENPPHSAKMGIIMNQREMIQLFREWNQ